MPRVLPVLLLLLSLAAGPAAAARAGVLRVKSTPSGAAVWVDGRPAGVTPTALRLSGGQHTVSVALPGHGVQTRRVSVKRGGRKTLKARLTPVPALTSEARSAVQNLFEARSSRLREWKGIHDLPLALLGGAGGLGVGAYDPELGLYYEADSLFTGVGFLLQIDFFLDAAHTEPAGSLQGSANLLTGLGQISYAFTAGPVAGAAADLTLLDAGDAVLLFGGGVLSDGSTWEADFAVLYGPGYLVFGGGVDLIAPDATKEHWSLEGGVSGASALVATSDGYRLTAWIAADGAGSAVLEHVPTGATLALVTWTADGEVTLTYGDGTTETLG